MNKRKRQDFFNNKIKDIENNTVLNSEDYSTNTWRVLNKISKSQQKNSDSEDEVMKFSDEEKESITCDIEDLKNCNLPNEKAWGKKKKYYYSTDYIDTDYSSVSQKDIVDAELEEQDARNLQKQLTEYLDETDFGLDLIESKTFIPDKDSQYIKTDLSKLNKRDKQEHLEQESSELLPLVSDCHDQLTEVRIILGPFLNLVKKNNFEDYFTINFVKIKYNLLLNYCSNILFYLMLKAKRKVIFSHPVIKRLVQYRQILYQCEEYQNNILNEIKRILEANKKGKPLDNSIISSKTSTFNKKSKKVGKYFIEQRKNNIVTTNIGTLVFGEKSNTKRIFGKTLKENKTKAEKRAITYQIAKNKGLTPNRKKEQRNPRVKHRNKYRKAQIHLKGVIRKVRKETTKYDGEISGIKTNVKKSIKLK